MKMGNGRKENSDFDVCVCVCERERERERERRKTLIQEGLEKGNGKGFFWIFSELKEGRKVCCFWCLPFLEMECGAIV